MTDPATIPVERPGDDGRPPRPVVTEPRLRVCVPFDALALGDSAGSGTPADSSGEAPGVADSTVAFVERALRTACALTRVESGEILVVGSCEPDDEGAVETARRDLAATIDRVREDADGLDVGGIVAVGDPAESVRALLDRHDVTTLLLPVGDGPTLDAAALSTLAETADCDLLVESVGATPRERSASDGPAPVAEASASNRRVLLAVDEDPNESLAAEAARALAGAPGATIRALGLVTRDADGVVRTEIREALERTTHVAKDRALETDFAEVDDTIAALVEEADAFDADVVVVGVGGTVDVPPDPDSVADFARRTGRPVVVARQAATGNADLFERWSTAMDE